MADRPAGDTLVLLGHLAERVGERSQVHAVAPDLGPSRSLQQLQPGADQIEHQPVALQDRRGRAVGLDSHFVTRIFHEIIDDSVRLQQETLQRRANQPRAGADTVRVAFHGIQGSYSYLAAREHFSRLGDQAAFLGRGTFEDVIKAVENGQADYAILPIENTMSGGMNEVYDLLLHSQIAIVGEEKYKINHCLISAEPASIEYNLCTTARCPSTQRLVGVSLHSKAFRATVGLADSSPYSSSAQVTILTDGTQRYEGTFGLTESAAVAFDLTGVFRITITAVPTADGIAAIGHPQVLCNY